MKNLSKYQGCLIGGAVGDALGYTVEFKSISDIKSKHGEKGITGYELSNGKALISDDTQMTLFTANGLLLGTTRGKIRGIIGEYSDYIGYCYLDWYKTQTKNYPVKDAYQYTWLLNIPELFSRRAPGNTCLQAIADGCKGNIYDPVNDSKGCGGVMRVAPIGVYFEESELLSQNFIDMIGAKTAALTHGHPLGYIPAAALVHIVSRASHNENKSLYDIVENTRESILSNWGDNKYIDDFISIYDKAVILSKSELSDEEAISQLGEGWVAEETLAIAVYCALKHQDDFEKALIASVNHNGDSDSTGAVTGNILGAYLGIDAIPQKFIEKLELKEIIMDIAEDLYNDCKMSEYSSYYDKVWDEKYIHNTYNPANN